MIDVFADHLYVTMYRSESVYRFPKFYNEERDAKDFKKIASGIRHVGDVIIIHSKKQIIRNSTGKIELHA